MKDPVVTVVVVKYPDRKNLMIRFTDPVTGKQIAKSTGTTNRRQAEREAARWEAELQEGRYQKPVNMSWEDFRERYEALVMREHAESTLEKVTSVFNAVERLVAPRRLRDLDDQRLLRFKEALHDSCSISTVASYMAHVKSALNTAVDWGILPRAPKIPKVKRSKGAKLMRGRAVSEQEFERMLAAVPNVVGAAAAPRGSSS